MTNSKIYKSKLITADEAAALIKDGDRVVTAFGCCEPVGIERAIEKNYKNYKDVQISNMLILVDTPWVREEMKGHITYNSFSPRQATEKRSQAVLPILQPAIFMRSQRCLKRSSNLESVSILFARPMKTAMYPWAQMWIILSRRLSTAK